MSTVPPNPDNDCSDADLGGYPGWKKDQRVEQLQNCYVVLPLPTMLAISGNDAVVKVAAALHCQANMEGKKTRILPYAAWKDALGLSKRTFLRALATLEQRGLIRRDRRGPGRKATVELLGPLAQFVADRRQVREPD
jgi:hypothetical protein